MPRLQSILLFLGIGLALFADALAKIVAINGFNASTSHNKSLELPIFPEFKDTTSLIGKPSVQDEEAIRAVENYEFEYLQPDSSSDYSSSSRLQIELEPLASASHDDHHHGKHPKIGYSVGGPLVNIAQGAAAQASTFEKNQPAAAAQAAYVAKNRLGQSAGLSAATAAAAFAGKQIILRGLEQQAYNAKRALEGEKLQLQQAQRSADAASNAAQQAMAQVQVITTALNAAQTTSQHASAAASAAAAELAAQTAMVGAAKARVQALEEQLYHARIDFEAAQQANFEAMRAAQAAQNNAAAAAAHAAAVASQGNEHKQQHHSAEKLEELEEYEEDEEDEDERESIAVPVSTSASATAAQQVDKTGQVATAELPNYPRASAILHAVREDELYDLYDSFPY